MVKLKYMYDCIIIGAGPAGLTAGIYLARKNISTLILTDQLGGQMVWSSSIQNYPGLVGISGADLLKAFVTHLDQAGSSVRLQQNQTVVSIDKNITSFAVETQNGDVFYAKSIIIASGREPKHLGVPGERELYGKGVFTCASCDSSFVKDKDIAVIGGGNSALETLLVLAKTARKLFSFNLGAKFGGEAVLQEKVQRLANLTCYFQSLVLSINGKNAVESITFQDARGQIQQLSVAGVFVEIGLTPRLEFDRLTKKTVWNTIKVNADMSTSVAGIFAAGDCNDSVGEQIIIAAGEGAKAALGVVNFLNRLS